LPASVGVAIDVPDSARVCGAVIVSVTCEPTTAAETMLLPGAAMSGLTRPSAAGPRFD